MRRRYVVSGHVQGVGFRRFVQRKARDLRLSGYAANLPDGRVEVVVEGDEAAMGHLEKWLNRGPSLARVTQVQVQPAPEGDALTGFTTR
ncbi:MAG: acylphosphatase [Gemmatimonadales bacterium]